VPVSEAWALADLLEGQRVAHEVRIYPQQGHLFGMDLSEPAARDARQRTLAFLRKHLKNQSVAAAGKPGPPAAGEIRRQDKRQK
jgi:hypothetical protein